MTKDEILLIADQFTDKFYVRSVTRDLMIGFARVIAAKEREACAELCEVQASVVVTNAKDSYQEGRAMGATVCAAAIRARGETNG